MFYFILNYLQNKHFTVATIRKFNNLHVIQGLQYGQNASGVIFHSTGNHAIKNTHCQSSSRDPVPPRPPSVNDMGDFAPQGKRACFSSRTSQVTGDGAAWGTLGEGKLPGTSGPKRSSTPG